jgi:hypothetical protein
MTARRLRSRNGPAPDASNTSPEGAEWFDRDRRLLTEPAFRLARASRPRGRATRNARGIGVDRRRSLPCIWGLLAFCSPLQPSLRLCPLCVVEDARPLLAGHLALHRQLRSALSHKPGCHGQDASGREELSGGADSTVPCDEPDPSARREARALDLTDELAASQLEASLGRLRILRVWHPRRLRSSRRRNRRQRRPARTAIRHVDQRRGSQSFAYRLDCLDAQRLAQLSPTARA